MLAPLHNNTQLRFEGPVFLLVPCRYHDMLPTVLYTLCCKTEDWKVQWVGNHLRTLLLMSFIHPFKALPRKILDSCVQSEVLPNQTHKKGSVIKAHLQGNLLNPEHYIILHLQQFPMVKWCKRSTTAVVRISITNFKYWCAIRKSLWSTISFRITNATKRVSQFDYSQTIICQIQSYFDNTKQEIILSLCHEF